MDSPDVFSSIPTEERRYYLAVGLLCKNWIGVEVAIIDLAEEILGLNETISPMVLRHLGNLTLRDIVLDISKARIMDKELADFISHAMSHFDICRANRNAIIHSSYFPHHGGVFVLPPDRNRREFRYTPGSTESVIQVAKDCENCASIISGAQFVFMDYRDGKTSPSDQESILARQETLKGSPLPKRLHEIPQNPAKPKHPPRP